MTRGRTLAGEREWVAGARGSARRFRIERIEKVYKRFWWPHAYAREAGLLWRKVVVKYRYRARDRHGFLLEVNHKGEPLPAPPDHPNCRCTTGDKP